MILYIYIYMGHS